jgi:phage terminase small subunit
LTHRQKALVDTIIETGSTITDAAKVAGYADRSAASVALNQPHVQAYMMQATAATLGKGSMWAAARMLKLSQSAKSEYVQLEASKDILDRAGFKPPERHQHQVQGDIKVSIDLG